MASIAQRFYFKNTKQAGNSANVWDLDDAVPPSQVASTVITYSTNSQVQKRIVPFTTVTATTAAPAVGTAASGNGWKLTDANANSGQVRRIAPGTFTVIGSIGSGGYALLAGNPSYTLTAILYRISTAGVSTELGRGSATATAAQNTAFALSPTITLAETFLQPGETIQLEFYLTAQATQNALGQVTNNNVLFKVEVAGNVGCVDLPAPGLRTRYQRSDLVSATGQAIRQAVTVGKLALVTGLGQATLGQRVVSTLKAVTGAGSIAMQRTIGLPRLASGTGIASLGQRTITLIPKLATGLGDVDNLKKVVLTAKVAIGTGVAIASRQIQGQRSFAVTGTGSAGFRRSIISARKFLAVGTGSANAVLGIPQNVLNRLAGGVTYVVKKITYIFDD